MSVRDLKTEVETRRFAIWKRARRRREGAEFRLTRGGTQLQWAAAISYYWKEHDLNKAPTHTCK